ncbi:putative esterase [Neolewinella xylanilytica]|uniref:Putative esterase n=1 Tax=Neolewinella xylanilytica TaxID=1514080 RepID=A0A2S6I0A9_9BACT|nr:alpha/beta fold hydrolase [Neolewinella xylanilytica]PPK84294.1 putative esterase [Neolewinella xylanilytica]
MTHHRLLIGILCLHLVALAHAQERQGNIVEYFGKEKIDEVSEGEILHLFEEGLLLTGLPRSFGVEPVRYEAVLADFVGTADTTIAPGDAYRADGGEALAWDTITINEKGEFSGNVRGGYLFLTYEADRARTVLLEASGHTTAIVNGMPHEGDHYDFGWSLVPLHLRPGANYILLSGGRFNQIRARLLVADEPVQFTRRDMTLPDLLVGESDDLWAAVRLMNTTTEAFRGGTITARVGEASAEHEVGPVEQLLVQKVPFRLPTPTGIAEDSTYAVVLELRDRSGQLLDTLQVEVNARSKDGHHKETFVSAMDGSVQYYSVVPPLTRGTGGNGIVLTVHGASVEAVNQAAAYRPKDSLYIVAATNRRPFGFAWEDWGRRDAIEVLDIAQAKFQTDPQRSYLTGHSMGGHGTWHIGVTYPDRFAAIGPAAGYADLTGYRKWSLNRLISRPDSFFVQWGTTRADFLRELEGTQPTDELQRMADNVLRAGNQSRTLKLKDNYLHYGVYILHGEKDEVVPTGLAREMRALLGTYHDDFAYYEYPDGAHWFGSESVDWPPLFDFFNFRRLKTDEEVDQLRFQTASPGISASSHYVTIWQQERPWEISSFDLERGPDTLKLTTDNTRLLRLDLSGGIRDSLDQLELDGQVFAMEELSAEAFFAREQGSWAVTTAPPATEKSPARYGSFKDAFTNNMVFVYATSGSEATNEWYLHRARYDAERWGYRGNGSITLVKDTDFRAADYPDRNVIMYGNRDNNAAWSTLLDHAPFDVTDGTMTLGDKQFAGSDVGAYLIYPRSDSDTASVGVVTATGAAGRHAAYANDYFLDTTFYPDVLIFSSALPRAGVSGLIGSGYFGNDWQVGSGDFEWNPATAR